MRINPVSVLLVSYAVLVCGCSTAPSAPDTPVSVPVSCTANQSATECLRAASELCGENGYDLFDSAGNPVSVADLKNDAATARCRTGQSPQ